jgi:hypothetical protein
LPPLVTISIKRFYDREIAGPIKISIGVRAAFSGITLPRCGLLDQSNFRLARDSVTITKVPETTACRVLPNARGKVKLPAAEAGHHHD